MLRKTRKDLADVGECINSTIAEEMRWANRMLEARNEVQQLRFNERGEARVVRVSVPKELRQREAVHDMPTPASVSRSSHRRKQHETLQKATQETGRGDSGWEVEMPLRFRVVRGLLPMLSFLARGGRNRPSAVRSPRCCCPAHTPLASPLDAQ